MSRSSLWAMNPEFEGIVLEEYKNSWLVTPIIWDILYNKYLPEDGWYELGGKRHKKAFISALDDNTLWGRLNEKLNNSENQTDRVAWEMGAQQIFYTKDRTFVAEHLKKFLDENLKYWLGEGPIGGHVFERFEQVANDIAAIEEEKYPYFLFKNTSVDDEVEWWFEKTNDETEEYDKIPLSKQEAFTAEFVHVKDGKIVGWTSALNFFKNLKEETK